MINTLHMFKQTLDKYWAGTDGVTDSKKRSRLLDDEADGSEEARQGTTFCEADSFPHSLFTEPTRFSLESADRPLETSL